MRRGKTSQWHVSVENYYLVDRYSTIEQECLALKLGVEAFEVEAFKVYLIGRPFIIEIDHCSLK